MSWQCENQRDFRPVVVAFLLLLSISVTNFAPTVASSLPLHSPQAAVSSQTHNANAPSAVSSTLRSKAESRSEVSSSPATPGDPSSSPLTYHGGPIQVQQNVYLIFWLPSGQHFEPTGNDSNFESLIARYFNDVGGSQFYGILTQYPDILDGSPTTSVHLAGAFVDSDPYPAAGTQSAPITGSQIIDEIQSYISSGSIPVGIDSAFFVFTAYGINTCQDSGETICSFTTAQSAAYCAYHSSFAYGSSTVAYAEMGDYSGCEISLASVGATAYPNNDGIADSEISLASQEQFDIVSDPLLDSWYSASSSTGEISDACAGDYGSVNPTTGNIVMNSHNYIVQLEWSNSAGACTLSPPAVTSVQFTMTVNSGGNSVSPSNYFQMTYAIGKQLFVGEYTGQPLHFSADPGTTLSVSAMSSSSTTEEWCLSLPCQPYTVNLGTGSQSITIGYYDLMAQAAIELSSSQPSSFDTVSYSTAPSSPGATASPLASTLTLSLTSQTIWVLRGSTISVPQQTILSTSSSQERWYTSQESVTVTAPNQLQPVQSFQQYLVTYGYQIAGGNTATGAPSVLYFSLGQPQTVNGGVSEWSDASSQFDYPQSLGTSSATERWEITPGTGTGIVSSALNLDITYYEQFNVSVGFTVVGGTGNTPSVSFSADLFGAPISFSVNSQSPTNSWVDAGSTYLLPNLLTGSTSSERWYAAKGTNGTISSTTLSISPTYYHQYSISFSYSVKTTPGGNLSLPSQPSLLFSNLSSTSTLKLSATSTAVWVNAGSNYSLSSVIPGTSGTERWAASGSSDIATQPGSTNLLLYDQYEVHFLVVITGGGTPGEALLNTTAFGQVDDVGLNNATSEIVWIDAGSPYSITNPLSSSSVSERWIASVANATGIVSSARSVSVHYYHQYLEILSYSITNGGSPSGGPSVSFTSLGANDTATATTQGLQEWADAGTKYSFAQTLPGSSSTERWNENNATTSGVFTSALTVNIAYDHQFYVSATANTPAAQLGASANAWYEPGTGVLLMAPSTPGWKFEEWVGTYFENASSLALTVNASVSETATYYVGLSLTAQGSASIHYSFGKTTGSVPGGQSETIYVPPNYPVKLTGSASLIIYKFSGWTGNASVFPVPINSTKAKLDTKNPLDLPIDAPSSVIAGSSVNYVSLGIIGAIIVVGGVVAFLLRRRPPPPSEFQEARAVENQPITRTKTTPE